MKTLLVLLLLLGVPIASATDAIELLSPSGKFHARADMPPGVRHVVLVLTHVRSDEQTLVFTKAAGSWAIIWTTPDVLLLIATESDDQTPIRAFEMNGDRFADRAPTQAEIKLACEAYEKKHGKKYEPNKTPQSTTSAVTLPAGQEARQP